MSDPVGIVGLGLMGSALARRLIAAGFSVVGYDVDAAKNDGLVALGGRAAAEISDLARQANPIVLAVFDTDQVEQVMEGPILAALGARSGKIVMCTSTCDVAARVRFLETPVSGTSEQVRRGEGVGLIGGDPKVAAEISGVLDAVFPVRFHVGGPGDGGRAKLAVNLVLGLNRVALAEGLVFATRLGLDPNAFLEIARASAAYSQVMDTKGEKMAASDFAPEGRARQTLKDVHLMLEQAQRLGQGLPLVEVHRDILTACVAAGEGDLDNSVVVNEIRRRGVN